ncbi:hypothetical protein EJ02DRAFT_98700 [Clathrospora elynae]|uniref:HTH luxR-type domain-containing protein n=1 Tax=Clathrospora elynae TaxID=706981 RepID=A0A6A5T5G2_9PLEO|nr:hypothetical protein EJ02DRAFT_98700 [Clathrospora elynae]
MSPPLTPRHTLHLSRDQRIQVQTLSLAGHNHQHIEDLLRISVRQVGYAIHAEMRHAQDTFKLPTSAHKQSN